MNRRLVLLADEERVAAALRLEDVVAVPLEDRAREGADRLLVLDEENGLGASPRLESPERRLAVAADGRIGLREIDLDGRPLAELAVDPDGAAALPHDAEHRGETEPGAFPLLLGGEERLEDPLARARRPCPSPVSVTASIT